MVGIIEIEEVTIDEVHVAMFGLHTFSSYFEHPGRLDIILVDE